METAYYGHNTNEQDIQINIMDAETKQTIRKDFHLYEGNLDPVGDAFRTVKDGSAVLRCKCIAGDGGVVDPMFYFLEDQIRSFGYDYNSIEGNSAKIEIDPITHAPSFPWVINIYMRKL